MSAIYVRGVSKTYKRYEKQERIIDNFFRRKYKEKVAVDDISFEIGKGERVAIIGQNGAGKTTLMKMLSGLLLPTAGEIKVLNYIPFKKEKEYKKSMTLLMGQKQQLWWDVSANDNFLLLKDIYELTSSEYNKNINELVEMLNLFPNNVQQVFNILPFKYLIYYPTELLVSGVNFRVFFRSTGILFVWMLFFYVTMTLVWRKGIKHYELIGG